MKNIGIFVDISDIYQSVGQKYPGKRVDYKRYYEFIEDLWKATLQLVKECPCESGCPACVQSPKCGNYNEPLDKRAAVVILEGLVGKAG